MNDNIIPEGEIALLSGGYPERALTNPTGAYFTASKTRVYVPKFKYDRKSELHDLDKHSDKEAKLSRRKPAIRLNQASPVRLMTCIRRGKQPKIKTQARPRV